MVRKPPVHLFSFFTAEKSFIPRRKMEEWWRTASEGEVGGESGKSFVQGAWASSGAEGMAGASFAWVLGRSSLSGGRGATPYLTRLPPRSRTSCSSSCWNSSDFSSHTFFGGNAR
ncbi:hypothetical protein CDAR_544581 [Caerostris darwini]|uniref:Uncharacterized protein n=1 Tax=Caerostris darwini TaxID=1538125 RepID=A0AAV4QHS0_9ARAC|nr:hypothetical protein CDAR_544581 [Caerostris darwini]